MADAKIFRLFIATMTVDGPRMTIEKSKEPIIRNVLSVFFTGSLIICVLMGSTAILPFAPPLWRQVDAWMSCFGLLTVQSLGVNVRDLPDLVQSDQMVLDKAQDLVLWNQQHACRIAEIESVRICTRLHNGITHYRVSLILSGNRAFHLLETTPWNAEEYFRAATRNPLQPYAQRFTEWKASSTPTGGDNGGNDQLAFVWILARFLNVPIA